jgi:hypothetical protein
MLHHVKDLSPEQRVAVEALLGRAMSNEEAVSVRSVVPASVLPSPLSDQERHEAVRQMDAYFAKIDSRRKPVTEENKKRYLLRPCDLSVLITGRRSENSTSFRK